jgi:hypothetical protein
MRDEVTNRILNRTVLERQFLLERTALPTLDVLARLVALQAQEPNWPYVGLWSRIEGFEIGDLGALLASGEVVRSGLLRSTQHFCATDDFLWLRPTVQPALDRMANTGGYRAEVVGLERPALLAAAREVLGSGTISRRELARQLGARFPGSDGRTLATIVELTLPIVQSPSAGAWGRWGTRSGISVRSIESDTQSMASSQVEKLILRYLAGFGPGSVKDLQGWSGLSSLGASLEQLRPGLRTYRSEDGVELFDLEDARLSDPELAAPVRFLPSYDNLILAHSDRSRLMSVTDRQLVSPGYSLVRPTFLVDGFVTGTWELAGSTIRLTLFRPVSNEQERLLVEEADRLLSLVAPGASHSVAFA